MRVGRKPALAASAALTAAVLALAFVLREDDEAAPVVAKASVVEPPPERLTFPPQPAAGAVIEPPPAARAEEFGRMLCDACLPERAVIDVAKTYLRRLDPSYLQGEIWAHPVADVVSAPIPRGQPTHRVYSMVTLPKLPAGLLGAPEENPFGMSVDPSRYPVETTWFVWVQTGWIPRERIEGLVVFDEPGVVAVSPEELSALESGEVTLDELRPGDRQRGVEIKVSRLPLVALSWPPIKKETYIAIDSRTGELRPDGIFQSLTSTGPWYPPHHGEALDMAKERVGEWFRGEATLSSDA